MNETERLVARIDELEKKVDRLTSSIESLVYAWRTATGVVRVVKWTGKIAASIAAIIALIKLAMISGK